MKSEGPYREPGNPNPEVITTKARALKKMEEEIIAEKNLSLHLPEDLQSGSEIPNFVELMEVSNPEGITLYSLATGILKYKGQVPGLSKTEILYIYGNPDNNSMQLTVSLNKKERPPATIFSMPIETQKRKSSDEESIQNIKGMAETGTREDLKELKIDLERLLFTINDKLKKND